VEGSLPLDLSHPKSPTIIGVSKTIKIGLMDWNISAPSMVTKPRLIAILLKSV
jgi:hypothetical protein